MSINPSFTITDQAKTKISSLLEDFTAQFGKVAVPALMWVDSDQNKQIVESQLAIGYYDNRSEIEDDIVVIDGLELVLAFPDEYKIHFEGKMLDCIDDRLVLR